MAQSSKDTQRCTLTFSSLLYPSRSIPLICKCVRSIWFYTNDITLHIVLQFAFCISFDALSIPVYKTTLLFLKGAYIWIYPKLTSIIDRYYLFLLVSTD